ncbi:MAG: nucleoside-triphosphatase, partial [Anaerovorax sp.]
MHIFLTGVPGVGKSTIVSSVVEELHKEIAGFSTIGEPIVGNNPSNVVMYNLAAGREDSMIVAHRYGDGRYKGDAPAFDTFGTKTLLDFKEIDLVIMDELGFMENEAYAFQKMVMTVLDGNIPVLGVIKPRNTA